MENVRDTADRWGGNFEIEYAKNYMGTFINKWKDNGGKVVHLTMYGSQAHEIVGEVQKSCADILIVVGGAKVPGRVYKSADWNVSVTTQPALKFHLLLFSSICLWTVKNLIWSLKILYLKLFQQRMVKMLIFMMKTGNLF